ncbi:hypothetical protein MUK72_19995 (plasmid) [Halococcus dombrowskii]|uniref:Uncharacterized protein n=1 Tax=Halococcus dombrowskii TaxID=179637 RepID=A0AAV3SK17_HALDO|nr:hypothetical protein [Halococcus dombrowskii]UOO97562.1 hypothetical protein MUK72_19995 [Halococcus dombrowskii]
MATSADDSEADGTFVQDVLDDVVYNLLGIERYADPDDPVGGALFGPLGELISALRESWEWLDPWLSVVRTLLDAPGGPPSGRTVATVGIEPEQASLTAAMDFEEAG